MSDEYEDTAPAGLSREGPHPGAGRAGPVKDYSEGPPSEGFSVDPALQAANERAKKKESRVGLSENESAERDMKGMMAESYGQPLPPEVAAAFSGQDPEAYHEQKSPLFEREVAEATEEKATPEQHNEL
jgi:hypothetical protein